MLFISKGRLRHPFDIGQLSGDLYINDEDNLATIIGKFTEGRCQKADIYRNDDYKLTNITVVIDKDGQLYVGGEDVKEQHFGETIYKGGYSGYNRRGFGCHYFEANKCESGIWQGSKKNGEFIEEYQERQKQEYSILHYENSQCHKQTRIIMKHPIDPPRIIQQVNGERKKSEDMQLKQIVEWKKKLPKMKQEMRSQNTESLRPLTKQNTMKVEKYKQIEIKQSGKLTLDMCEIYLQFLFHSQEYQSKSKTAIFSIHTVYLFDKIYRLNKEHDEESNRQARKEANHLLLQYRSKYCLFRGFWNHIIIPLVLSETYNHFSFLRISIKEKGLQCTYYDSYPYNVNYNKMKERYFQAVKQSLIHQLLKDSKNIKRKQQISKMSIIVDESFPCQDRSDKVSCGYYMLQGISDLMKFDKITFKTENLQEIKKGVLYKLRQLCSKDSE